MLLVDMNYQSPDGIKRSVLGRVCSPSSARYALFPNQLNYTKYIRVDTDKSNIGKMEGEK